LSINAALYPKEKSLERKERGNPTPFLLTRLSHNLRNHPHAPASINIISRRSGATRIISNPFLFEGIASPNFGISGMVYQQRKVYTCWTDIGRIANVCRFDKSIFTYVDFSKVDINPKGMTEVGFPYNKRLPQAVYCRGLGYNDFLAADSTTSN